MNNVRVALGFQELRASGLGACGLWCTWSFMGSYKGSFKGSFKGMYRDSIKV